MKRMLPFLFPFALAAACGDSEVVITKETVVEKPTYVCMDAARTRVADWRLCPVDPPVVKKETRCVDGTVVEDGNACADVCPAGFAYDERADACVPLPQVRGTVSVHKPNGGVPVVVDTQVGVRSDVFPLVIQDDARAVSLADVRFLAYVGVEQDGVVPDPSVWLSAQTDVAAYLGDCLLTDQDTGLTAGPVAVDHVPLSEQAMVFFPAAVGSGTVLNLSVACALKPSAVAYHVALVLDLVHLVDAETGEAIPATEVTFDGLNSDFGYQVRAAPLPACPAPVLQLSPDSPDHVSSAALPEVLRFDVIADPACRDLQTWSVQYAVVDNGWYEAPSTAVTSDVRDPTRPLFTNRQTTVSNGDFLFFGQDAETDAVPIQASRPLTLRLQMDVSASARPGTDTLRVDVVRFCYRDPGAVVEACVDQGPVPVTGNTLTF